MSQPALRVSTESLLPTLEVKLSRGLSVEFRLQIVARWGEFRSRERTDILNVPRDVFLRETEWLRRLCVDTRTPIDWSPAAHDLLMRQRAEEGQVAALLAGDSLPLPDLADRLASSRHVGGFKDFQIRDLARLLSLPNGANFSVPGAGKTMVTYALFDAERLAGRVDRLLVIAPISAFEAWADEASRWLSPTPTVHIFNGSILPTCEVLLINYQRLVPNYPRVSGWITERPTHVVLDEAHRIKRGWTGAWGHACLSLAPLATRRDVLTGTPAPNHPSDLAPVIDFIWPGQGRRVLPEGVFARDPLPHEMAEAARAIAPLFVRTNKREMGLPTPRIIPHILPLTGVHKEVYDALRRNYAGVFRATKAEAATLLRMGKVVMYLLEAATNPALLVAGSASEDPLGFRHPPLEVPPESDLWELINRYGDYETPVKFEELARILNSNVREGRKTLVWSNFVRNLRTLAHEFQTLNPALVYGAVPSGDPAAAYLTREAELRRFRDDPECYVLFANPASLAEGVSLHHECRDAVYVERTFNAGHYLQSLDRIHRLGLDPSLNTRVHLLLTEGTVDEVCDQRLTKKIGWLESLLEDHSICEMSLPDEEDVGMPLDSEQDIQALLRHLRGDNTLRSDDNATVAP